jgi:6-phosphofructokinase
MRRVGLLTGGGDCPGLNAVIRAASRTAFHLGWEVWGIEDGFDGLLTRNQYPLRKGKTVVETDRSDEVVRNFRALGLDALVAIGGDGTLGMWRKERWLATGSASSAGPKRWGGSRAWAASASGWPWRSPGTPARRRASWSSAICSEAASPPASTGFDRLLGTRFGAAAMRMVAEGRFGTMVALHPRKCWPCPWRGPSVTVG